MEDLDEAVSHFTELILLQPLSWLPYGSMIFRVLYLLSGVLVMRSKISDQPEDAISAAKYLLYLRDQPHPISDLPRQVITASLLDALAMQVELEAGDVKENTRQMAVLCHEHLTSGWDTSDVFITRLIHSIWKAVSKVRMLDPDQPLDKLFECLQAARKHRPDLLVVRLVLAQCHYRRYLLTFENEDYEKATSILDQFIALISSPVFSQNESFAAAQHFVKGMVTSLAKVRSLLHQTPEYLEEAIYRTHASHGSFSFQDFSVILDPKDTAKQRFDFFGSIEGAKGASGLSPSSQLGLLITGDDEFLLTLDKMYPLLFAIRDNDDTTKIDEAIEKGRTILTSYSPTDPLKAGFFDVFGDMLQKAFRCTHKIEYLNELISVRRQVTEYPFLRPSRSVTFPKLSRSLLYRFVYSPGDRTQDLNEALELLSQCVSDAPGYLPDRFSHACMWATVARATQHPTVTTAYEAAMSLMQDTLHFSPTLQLQHATLATHDSTYTMPLDYASHQVDLGQLEKAIETLERGRALLWSEMRHLRTSIDRLLATDPDLGHNFAAINRELEGLTKSVPPCHKISIDDGTLDDLRAVDPFGRLVLKRRRLLKERDDLISQIQALPGFDDFMTSPPFDTLRSAGWSGPVIIINHSRWRSDIMILYHYASPSLIPTPPAFYKRACALKDNLLDSRRKYGLSSSDYDETLASVLAELYILVGQPVIDRLRQLQVPEQSRIWWCPTSVFCSLPLHAMGPIPSDVDEPRYFIDLYVCSYTPTLSALIQSRNRSCGPRSSDRPSILLVAQPDPSLPTVGGEIQVVQLLDTKVTSLISAAATPAAVVDGFNHHGFVHFACHGTLELGKPFEAGFELHGGKRLTLLDIVRSHLPAAEFAFLSACHTAEVTEGSIIDEGLHLAAAVQYCGFRSVVGTMWAMVDEDGRDLAKYFYKALFSPSRQDEGIPYHERSATALRFAVQKLRRKRWITLERWVNFVHYGA